MTIVYEIEQSLYLNITNRCTNSCDFCIRDRSDVINGKYVLWLEHEPDVEKILEEINKFDVYKYREVVACGYGEPLVRYDTVFEVFRQLKGKDKDIRTRINTNGHGNLIAGHDITPGMEGIVDTISISMNAKNAMEYDKICHSIYGDEAFDGMLLFARAAKKYVPNVILTVVDILSREDIDECKKIAANLGVIFRVREMES